MEAIILSRTDANEFDQLISLYSKEKGYLKLIARGIKRPTSKNPAYLEPCSFVDIEYVPGKNDRAYIGSVEPIEYYTEVRGDFWKSTMAQKAMYFVKEALQEGEGNKKLFQNMRGLLKILNSKKIDSHTCKPLVEAFMLKTLHCLGYAPELTRCIMCGAKVQSGKCVPSHGGIVCNSHQTQNTGFLLQKHEIELMQTMIHGSWIMIHTMLEKEKTKINYLEFGKCILAFVEYYTEKQFFKSTNVRVEALTALC